MSEQAVRSIDISPFFKTNLISVWVAEIIRDHILISPWHKVKLGTMNLTSVFVVERHFYICVRWHLRPPHWPVHKHAPPCACAIVMVKSGWRRRLRKGIGGWIVRICAWKARHITKLSLLSYHTVVVICPRHELLALSNLKRNWRRD